MPWLRMNPVNNVCLGFSAGYIMQPLELLTAARLL